MDPDVRSAAPGQCRKCGMNLVAGIPDPREFSVEMRLQPRVPVPGRPLRMTFALRDPKTGKFAHLQVIHEKLIHLFIVSADLGYFAHEHPKLQPDGTFVYIATLPHAGEYRALCDFYPETATPQMIARTFYVPGEHRPAPLLPDLGAQTASNLQVSLRTDPVRARAGNKTMLFFTLDPSDGLEPYLGAWGHMLAASSDLIDLIHTHPAWENKSDTIQFNLIFPRPGIYRVWVQFQRLGIVNTVAFNVPVEQV
jgi:hypothetical protein